MPWYHTSASEILSINALEDENRADIKPRALYFGRDRQWVDWTRRERFKEASSNDHVYEAVLHRGARVLHIKDPDDFKKMADLYGLRLPGMMAFDWNRVKKDYDALIVEYQTLSSLDPITFCFWWVSLFDADTLVVFRPHALSSFSRVGSVSQVFGEHIQ